VYNIRPGRLAGHPPLLSIDTEELDQIIYLFVPSSLGLAQRSLLICGRCFLLYNMATLVLTTELYIPLLPLKVVART